jgi:hypothetical protein
MKVTIENTSKIVEIHIPGSGTVPARIWEGRTESGIPVHCYITRVVVARDQDQTQFETELQHCRAPSAEASAIPMRLIL